MPIYLLKFFDPKIINQLSLLFNHMLAISFFPEKWKEAKITPIPKIGKDKTIIQNWRPISQLTAISKTFEKVIQLRINTHLEHNNIIPDHQFGFREGLSTYHALAAITDLTRHSECL